MTTAATLNAEDLVAELLAEEVGVRGGTVGVVVQDVPHLDPDALLRRLVELDTNGQPLRIAYLAAEAAKAAGDLGLGPDVFATEVEQAERWRNERGLDAMIVVVASGDEARLSSLHDFDVIGPKELKRRLVRRAGNQLGETNDVQGRWWETLGSDERISFRQLLDYYGALALLGPTEAIARASREVHRIGLLPDPALFDNPRDVAIARRLDLNRELVSRLQTLTEKDRAAIAANIAAETDTDQRAALNRALRLLRQARRGERGLDELTLADAQALFGVRRTRPAPTPTDGAEPPAEKPSVRAMSALAADALAAAEPEEVGELEQALDALVERLNELEEPRLRPERLAVELDSGITVQGQARADLVNLVARLIGEDSYGAWIVVEGEDVDEMLRRFHGDQDIRARFTHEEIAGYLANFNHEAADAIGACFARYNELRREVLPLVRTLCAEPLAVAVVPGPRQLLLDYIAAYKALFDQLSDSYQPLFDEFSSEVDGVVSRFLSLELLVLGEGEHVSALLAPTHPLYLWHYAEYARVVDEQRDALSERDRRLVADAARDLPNFLTSLCVPPVAGEHTLTLPYISRIGPLPYFGPTSERAAGDDGLGPISTLIRAFPDVYPPARTGLRVTLVDPPDAGVYLSLLADLHERGTLDGAHLAVLRHPHEKAGTELRLTADDEDRVARIFRATTAERRFTYEITPLPAGALMPGEPTASHLLVLFDQSPRRQDRIRLVEHPIQPLAMTQRLQYRAQAKTVDLVPAPGGIFASYFGVAERLARSAPASYFAVHQAEELRQQLAAALETTQWLVVADRRVDRDLALGELRVATAQDGERDVAVFAASASPFRRAIRDVARQYNTAITDDQLAELLEELSDLLDAGVLSLRPNAEGKVNWAHVKGLLGLLIAAHWYRQGATEGRARLLLSLDDPVARRWLHLRDDALRADLIGIESGPTFCAVTVFEVKAVDTPQAEYQIDSGTITGPAVDQLLSMRNLLTQVFTRPTDDELITTPARREILREHAFRELTKARYTPEQRRYWVDVLETLFAGDLEPTLHLHLVDVHLGVDPDSLGAPRAAQARQDHTMIPVTVTKLNEAGIDALHQHTPPPEEPPPPPPEEPEPTSPAPPTPEDAAVAAPEPEVEPAPQPEPAPTSTPDDVGTDAGRVRVYLGTASGAYGKPREIWFDPELPDQRLPNRHISITGETGSGKTQATKAILHELLPLDLPVLILDFKDDYTSESYVESENLAVFDASFGGLPFNPLIPPVDLRSGRIAPMNHIHQLSEILKRIYRLGDQQTFNLREAIKEVYEIQGIGTEPILPKEEQTYLPFDAVREVLVREGQDALLGRLSPIFDLGLFAASSDADALDTLLASPAVIRLSQLPADEVKNAVAEFLLLALYNHLIRRPHESSLRRVLVLDEAWRLVNSPFLEPLMRESRAFGLSVLIATQFPKDLPDAVVGSTNTKMYFSQTQSDQIREIQRSLVGKTTGAEAEHVSSAVRGLRPLSCLLQNAQHAPYIRVDVKPYFERARDGTTG